MNRLLVVLLTFAASAQAHAQMARRALPPGDITGLEMTLEGPRHVAPGETARWLVAVHEIVRDRDFRPGAGVTVRAVASFNPEEPVAEANADGHGRATLEVAIPEDLDTGFQLIVDARNERRSMRRRFRLYVELSHGHTLSLRTSHRRATPGENVAVFGELVDDRGRPVAGEAVELVGRGAEGIVWGPETTTTDAHGFYAATARFPEGLEHVDVRASYEDADASHRLPIGPAPRRAVQMAAAPESAIAAPGATVPLQVVVRDRLGRPLEGALVSGVPAGPDEERAPTARTDARGRATLPWRLPNTGRDGEYTRVDLRAVAPGVGEGRARPWIRVTRRRHALAAVPEGNALLVGVPSRVYLRAVGADGSPTSGATVRLEGARLGSQSAQTDADGVAVVEVELAPEGAAPDACGGATAVAATLVLDEERSSTCLPVDPDGTVRVRAQTDAEGVAVTLHARSDVAREPILVTLLRREQARTLPIAQRVVPSGTTTLTVPTETQGRLLVRARPLVGAARTEVRGGMAALSRGDVARPLDLSATGDAPLIRGEGRVVLVAQPLYDALRLHRDLGSPSAAGPLLASARLAESTPSDVSVPAVLRDRDVVTLPATEDPVSHGVLRDPWRQRARYRSGRLALVVRAIERYVASATDLDDVAERRGNRYRFNRAILDAIAEDPEIGAEGPRNLGGLPLGIDALEAMDPAFTFDRMARRITRERLMRALVRLREVVRRHQLDFAFARRSSPAEWIAALRRELEETHFIDAWKRPLALRPARARGFRLVEVVPGWELVSAGPDGRFGNGDDVVDPTARVLPSGSLYADAMDEDGLLARLSGVSLGRVTMEQLANVFGRTEAVGHGDRERAETGLGSLPKPLIPPADLDLLASRASAVAILDDPNGEAELSLPPTPTRYGVVAIRGSDVRVATMRRAGDVELAGIWPHRLGVGETLTLRPLLLGFDRVTGARLQVEAEGAHAEVLGGPHSLGAGDAVPIELRLRGEEPGRARIRLSVVDASGRTLWSKRIRPRVLGLGATRATWAGASVEHEWNVRFDLPEDARDAEGELLLVAPGGLARDPLVRSWRRQGAPVQAWAMVVAGADPDAELRASLGGPSELPDALAHACAATAWTAMADEEDDEWRQGFLQARNRLRRAETSDARVAAATLAALAPIAGGAPVVGGSDPIAQLTDQLRERLWNVTRELPEEPTVWARAAAALLLADDEDASGRAIWQAAARALEPSPRGGKWIPHEDPREGLAASAALLLAAQVVGANETARELREAIGPRAWLLLEQPGERAFWMLAASGQGGFGTGAASVRVDGREVPFEQGIARLPVRPEGRRVRLEVVSSGNAVPLARVRIAHRRHVPAVEGPLTLELTGDPGRAGSTAAFEISVEATEAVESPELLVQLPPGGLVDVELRARMAQDDDVVGVEAPDARGMLRVRLRTLASGASARFPLPVRWAGSGTTSGLAIAGFDARRPWHTASIPPREVVVRPAN